MTKIPALPANVQEWLETIRYFEFVKAGFPQLYPQVVGFSEERPGCAL